MKSLVVLLLFVSVPSFAMRRTVPHVSVHTTIGGPQNISQWGVDQSLANDFSSNITGLINGPSQVTQHFKQHTAYTQSLQQDVEQSRDRTESLRTQTQNLANENQTFTISQSSEMNSFSQISIPDLIRQTTNISPQKILIDPSTIPDPLDSDLPYQFQAPQGEFRDRNVRLYKDLFKITPQFGKQLKIREWGLVAVQESDAAFAQGRNEEASFYQSLGMDCLDIVVGLDPISGMARSLFELYTGRNFVTGGTLTSFERTLAALGVVTLGTERSFVNAATGVVRIARQATHVVQNVETITHSVREATRIAQAAVPNFRNLRSAISLLRQHGVDLATRREVIEAFTPGSRVITLAEDLPVYRYWVEGFNGPRGRWVTTELLENPHSALALPRPGPYRTEQWTIPAGSDIIEGLAGPNFGMPGGSHQIYIPNPGALL